MSYIEVDGNTFEQEITAIIDAYENDILSSPNAKYILYSRPTRQQMRERMEQAGGFEFRLV